MPNGSDYAELWMRAPEQIGQYLPGPIGTAMAILAATDIAITDTDKTNLVQLLNEASKDYLSDSSNAESMTALNKMIDRLGTGSTNTHLQSIIKGNVESNVAKNQKGNESSNFGDHVKKEQEINAGKGTGGYLNKPEQGGTLNIGAGNKPIEGAYNISHPDYPMGKNVYPGNANDLSNIATGSQNKVIIDNPYGYKPINNEVMRVLNKDGVLIIRGGGGNKYIRNIEKIAADNGLKLVEKKTISSKGYTQSDGSPIKNPTINEYIFKKK